MDYDTTFHPSHLCADQSEHSRLRLMFLKWSIHKVALGWHLGHLDFRRVPITVPTLVSASDIAFNEHPFSFCKSGVVLCAGSRYKA